MRIKLNIILFLLVFFSKSFAMNEASFGFTALEIAKIKQQNEQLVKSKEIQEWVYGLQNQESKNYSKPLSEKQKRTSIMILVSSSIPKESLNQYLVASKKIGASVVFRGLINNSFPDTAQYISPFLKHLKTGIEIDPIVFEKLKIEKVPAIVHLNQNGLYCLNSKNCIPDVDDVDIVYGNVSLEYALQMIKDKGVTDKNIMCDLIQKLKEKEHV